MTLIEILPNVVAAVSSLIASILLIKLALKMKGGTMSKMINYLVAGIVLAVFVHALFELASIFEVISDAVIFPVMGVLLSVGSILFIVAGYLGLKVFK